MGIQDEIRKQQQLSAEKEKQKNAWHKQQINEARKMIPEIAEYVKTSAARAYLRDGGAKGASVKKRFLGKRYYRGTIFFDVTDMTFMGDKIKWVRALKTCPEIYGELANAIRNEGLRVTSIFRNDENYGSFVDIGNRVYISYEFDVE